jgi:hypothetical protein
MQFQDFTISVPNDVFVALLCFLAIAIVVYALYQMWKAHQAGVPLGDVIEGGVIDFSNRIEASQIDEWLESEYMTGRLSKQLTDIVKTVQDIASPITTTTESEGLKRIAKLLKDTARS